MTPRNDVVLEGFLKFPEIRETKGGHTQFQGKIAVPFMYTDKKTGEQKTGSNYVKISAWRDLAMQLGGLPDGTPVRVQGSFNDRSYDGNCKECGSVQKKSWTDVLVNNFVVVEE